MRTATCTKGSGGSTRIRTLRRRTLILGFAAAALCGLGALWANQQPPDLTAPAVLPPANEPPAALRLEVVHPEPGGLPRTIVQTGSIEAFESAELYARVSGYLKSVPVDIGDRVEQGQMLAEIDAPELDKEVERHAALLLQAKSRVVQAEARLKTAQVQRQAAAATVQQAQADIRRNTAERCFREKEYQRISELAAQKAVEQKLVDEKQRQLDGARAGEEYASASALVARGELAAVDSQIEQARADLAAAQADVRVAVAAHEQAQVMAGYTRIVSPYEGVVIARNYDRGAFVRAATEGAAEPILTVARTDRMRAVVQIPDPEVPFIRPGQKAQVRIDTLGGDVFTGTVARISHHQDRRTRTMRAEIDLPNPDGLLGGGMYGAVTIFAPAPSDSQTLPGSCLVGRTRNGRGEVFVLRDGRLRLTPIGTGRSDAERTEVLSGLSLNDAVVVKGDAGMLDGAAAVAVSTRRASPPRATGEVTADLRP